MRAPRFETHRGWLARAAPASTSPTGMPSSRSLIPLLLECSRAHTRQASAWYIHTLHRTTYRIKREKSQRRRTHHSKHPSADDDRAQHKKHYFSSTVCDPRARSSWGEDGAVGLSLVAKIVAARRDLWLHLHPGHEPLERGCIGEALLGGHLLGGLRALEDEL